MSCHKLGGWSALGLALCLALSGCVATISEPAYAQVEFVPADIHTYPSTVYEGRVVYLVDGRWYYQRGSHWVYFYREPGPLRRYRVDHYRAPRAYPRPTRERYVAPPARRYVAPPARSSRDRRDPRRAPAPRRSERDRRDGAR